MRPKIEMSQPSLVLTNGQGNIRERELLTEQHSSAIAGFKNKNAFIIKTNKFDDFKKYVFKTWISNLPECYDAFIMFDTTYSMDAQDDIEKLKNEKIVQSDNIVVYNEDSFKRAGFHVISNSDLINTSFECAYKGNTMLIYNMVYQEPYFYQKFDNYDRYMFIEDDILFNGNYKTLFDSIKNINADFMPIDCGNWLDEWNLYRFYRLTTQWFEKKDFYKSLLQCCVYSKQAISALYDFYIKKNCIYNELGFPTVIKKNGLKTISFVDINLCIKEKTCHIWQDALIEKWNTLSTDEKINKLVHPVKTVKQLANLKMATVEDIRHESV